MVKTFEVALPIADILVIESVNHVFSEDQVRQEHVRSAGGESGRNQICTMDLRARVATANCGQHLIAQPAEVYLQLGQHVGGREVPRKRLMTVQHISWILLHDNVDRVEQALEVTLHSKRRAQVRHDEIADKEHAQIGEMDEHGVVRLTAMDGDQLDARSADFEFCGTVDRCVRLEIANILDVEVLTEEMSRNGSWRIEFAVNLFLIVASGVETRPRIQTAKVSLSANMVPMGMRDEDGGECREIRCVGAQRFVGGFGGVGTGPSVYTDQLPAIVGNHEIVFRELETRQRIDPAGNNLRNAR